VVQVGAFNDATRMREARQKVEKAGYKTYTSEVDSPTGRRTRVRLGPFATKKEAEAAAAKVKTVGLPANVLTL
jgi:DedD protein